MAWAELFNTHHSILSGKEKSRSFVPCDISDVPYPHIYILHHFAI